MNREDRLRRELAGTGLEDRAADLAGLPVAQVDLIVAALRASHRAGRDHEAQVRKRNRGRARDADEIAEGIARLLDGMGRRAEAGDLDAAAVLYDLTERRGPRLLRAGVAGLRAAGYSDPEIAAGLGVTRQAIGERFGRRGETVPGPGDTPGAPRLALAPAEAPAHTRVRVADVLPIRRQGDFTPDGPA